MVSNLIVLSYLLELPLIVGLAAWQLVLIGTGELPYSRLSHEKNAAQNICRFNLPNASMMRGELKNLMRFLNRFSRSRSKAPNNPQLHVRVEVVRHQRDLLHGEHGSSIQ